MTTTQGLIEAVKTVLPHAEHRQCARHIYANFRKKFTGVQYRNWFWAASKSSTRPKFDYVMNEMKASSSDAYKYLMEKNPSSWCRAYFKEGQACDSVENGISECFNALIVDARRKPIITMLEEIRVCLMERMFKMKTKGSTWNDDICPSIRKKLEFNKDQSRYWSVSPGGGNLFEVKQGVDGYVVDEEAHTCTCRMWQVSGIPCPHALAAICFINKNPDRYVSEWFRKSTFVACYNHCIKPMNGIQLWPKTPYVKPLPPRTRRMPGRPKIKRRRDASEGGSRTRSSTDEVSREGRIMTCKNCYQTGHNRKTCKNEKVDPPPKESRPMGRPRKQTREEISPAIDRNIGRGRGRTSGVRARGGGWRRPLGAGVSYDPITGEAMLGNSRGVPLPAWPQGVLPESVQPTQPQPSSLYGTQESQDIVAEPPTDTTTQPPAQDVQDIVVERPIGTTTQPPAQDAHDIVAEPPIGTTTQPPAQATQDAQDMVAQPSNRRKIDVRRRRPSERITLNKLRKVDKDAPGGSFDDAIDID